MTPMIVPFLATRNSPGSAIGALLGFAICGGFVAIMWGIRPIALPRHGEWLDGSYLVGDVKCGDVEQYSFQPGYSAYPDPPFWVGLGEYKTYRTEAEAKKAVEWSCQ